MVAPTALSLVGSAAYVRFQAVLSSSHEPRSRLGSASLNALEISNHAHCRLFCNVPIASRFICNSVSAVKRGSDDGFFSNIEDTDEMVDELFEKYGKVVFRSSGNKSPVGEVDDDSESLSFAVAMAKVASDVKAADIKVLFVKPLVYWTRFFIIATAFSNPQIDAIGSRMRDIAEKKYGKVASGDAKPNSWTLLDFGDVVIHIFLPQQREFYNLEEFYGNATPVELPFDNQPPPVRS